MEAPWGMAQLTFFADRRRVPKPPLAAAELLAWSRAATRAASPTRSRRRFHGTTFLKQLLLERRRERGPLQAPVTDAAFALASAPLWAYLERLHPQLWRGGRQFPANNVGAATDARRRRAARSA